MELGAAVISFLLGVVSGVVVSLLFLARPSVYVEVEFGQEDLPHRLTVVNPGPLAFFVRSLTVTPDGFGGWYLNGSPLFSEKVFPSGRTLRFTIARNLAGAPRDFCLTYSPMVCGRILPLRLRSRHWFDPQAHGVMVVAQADTPWEST